MFRDWLRVVVACKRFPNQGQSKIAWDNRLGAKIDVCWVKEVDQSGSIVVVAYWSHVEDLPWC